MKKWIACILALILVLSLCACGSSEGGEKKKEGLHVGFGRESIVPEYEVHMSGGDWKSRKNDGFRDMLYVTCVAMTEGGETLLFYTMDFIGSSDSFVDPAREAISKATGVPVGNIWMNATHTHAGVAISSEWDKTKQYREEFNEAATKAAVDAIADQAKAEVFYGNVETEGMAFVRHYNMADGTVAGSNFGSFSGSIVGHTVEADTRLQLVKFVREGEEKKDVLLMSFPAHCTMNQNSTSLSADFPAPAREYIEKNSNTLVAFFQGASGDQVPSSKIQGESFSTDYKIYGEKLGQYAIDGMAGLAKSESVDLRMASKIYEGAANKEKIDKLADAKAVQAVIDQYSKSSQEAKAAAAQYGFSSVYEATSIISRASAPETETMELRVFAVGEVGFVLAPYEMFCLHAKEIKENSPYSETFIATLGQGNEGYLPTIMAFEYGSYESHVTSYARGTGEDLAVEWVEMLTELQKG